MSEHKATIKWKMREGDFLRGRYSREHTWSFDGGITLAASSSPAAVPLPFSNPANVDPEEAYVASLSSCHMLTYLFIASRKGFVIARITYSGSKTPTAGEEDALHHAAHEQCFIANSVKTEVKVESELPS